MTTRQGPLFSLVNVTEQAVGGAWEEAFNTFAGALFI